MYLIRNNNHCHHENPQHDHQKDQDSFRQSCDNFREVELSRGSNVFVLDCAQKKPRKPKRTSFRFSKYRGRDLTTSLQLHSSLSVSHLASVSTFPPVFQDKQNVSMNNPSVGFGDASVILSGYSSLKCFSSKKLEVNPSLPSKLKKYSSFLGRSSRSLGRCSSSTRQLFTQAAMTGQVNVSSMKKGKGMQVLPSVLSTSSSGPLSTVKTFSRQGRKRKKKAVKDMSTMFTPVKRVNVYIAEKRSIQIGDKIAGRHGNKGIVSAILPQQDMPYLPDGTPLDLVLNPLGVPSRMNVGQIFECLLGLAGSYLHQTYKIQPFDELYGCEASRSLVYSKLYEARMKTQQHWLFDPNFPGKVRLFDGRTGQCFEQPVTVGKAYILKLIHLVDEKIHARSTGPYSMVTQQPLRGRSHMGGQRVGEMEVWALEGFGASYILQELLTIKSDDMVGRTFFLERIIQNQIPYLGPPESFRVLLLELQGLCIHPFVFGSLTDPTEKKFPRSKKAKSMKNKKES